MCVAPDQPPGEPLGVGIEQELVGIEAVAVLGLIRAVNAVAIELSGRNVIEVAVPDVLAALGKFDALELAPALAVEQAKLDFLRVGDRKSTRLNSSHSQISYAVFCLKKKKNT